MSINHVVLADRSNTIRKIVEWLFTDHGNIELKSFESGEGLQDVLLELKPAVVLVDINLPSFDGYGVCRFVNDNPALAHSKVIILKGAFDPVDESRLSELDYHEIITKPFDSSALVQMIEKIVSESKEHNLPPLPEDAPAEFPEDMPEEIAGGENGDEINFSDIKKELDDDGVMDAGGFITDFEENGVEDEVLPSEEVTQKGASGDQLTAIGEENQEEEDIMNPFADDSDMAAPVTGGETMPVFEQDTFVADSLPPKDSETAQVAAYQTDFVPEDVISDSSETFVADASEFRHDSGLEESVASGNDALIEDNGFIGDVASDEPVEKEEAIIPEIEDRWPEEQDEAAAEDNIEIPSFDAEKSGFDKEDTEEPEQIPVEIPEEKEDVVPEAEVKTDPVFGEPEDASGVSIDDDFEMPSFESQAEPESVNEFAAFDSMDDTPEVQVPEITADAEEETGEAELPQIEPEQNVSAEEVQVDYREPETEVIEPPADVIDVPEEPVAEVKTEEPVAEEPKADVASIFTKEDKNEIIRRVEERIAESVHQVVWEVVPVIAEKIVKEEIASLRKEIQDTIDS